jgi:dTDP-4-dehydrorhamnose reductase
MRLYVTGQTGLIGSHLWQMSEPLSADSNLTLIDIPRTEFDMFADSALNLITDHQPSHVLHLAWASTSLPNYDEAPVHQEWAIRTFALAKSLSRFGIVSWVVGTGLEVTPLNEKLSPYGHAKLELKEKVMSSKIDEIRWISMPYIFSSFHERPRIIRYINNPEKLISPLVEHDYLELRDVAFQLREIIDKDKDVHSHVTSKTRISNVNLLKRLSKTQRTQELVSCSCDPNNEVIGQDQTYFTSKCLGW